ARAWDEDLRLDPSLAIAVFPGRLARAVEDGLRAYNVKAKGRGQVIPLLRDELEELVKASPGTDAQVSLSNHIRRWLGQDDPFRARGPVTAWDFFGRDELLRSIITHIERGQHVGIFGLRKIGKTSTLHQLQLRERHHVLAYVDAQSCMGRSMAEVVSLFGQAIGRSLQRLGLADLLKSVPYHLVTSERAVDVEKSQDALEAFAKDLRRLGDALQGSSRKIVLLLDEVERLLPSRSREGFVGHERFFSFLRGAGQEGLPLQSVVAGSHANITDIAVLEGSENPVFNLYEKIFVTMLTADETRDMLVKLGEPSGFRFEKGALRRIFDLTGGHPFLTRQFASFLTAKRKRPYTVKRRGVEAAVNDFVISEVPTMRQMLTMFDSDMPGSAELLERAAMSREGATISRQELYHDGLRNLESYGILLREGQRITHTVEVFRRWLYDMAQ
ncbi:MAG: ATP-binding protein, partial [Deltaproteobacteria bacterium]|nr:ATP-binding protein [Deltaproteobacteria bacterium]